MLFSGSSAETGATVRARKHQLTSDTLARGWDFWAYVDQPLDDLRTEMEVPTLDPADGEHPDRSHSSA